MSGNLKDRYQFQPWYVRIWRRRHYIPIPFRALRFWCASLEGGGHSYLSFRSCWSIAKGLAQGRMNWVYDWSEVKMRMDKQFRRSDE